MDCLLTKRIISPITYLPSNQRRGRAPFEQVPRRPAKSNNQVLVLIIAFGYVWAEQIEKGAHPGVCMGVVGMFKIKQSWVEIQST